MNPTVRKMLAGIAIERGVQQIVRMRRRRKRSLLGRLRFPALAFAGGGAVFYLAKTGRLSPMLDQAKSTLSKEAS